MNVLLYFLEFQDPEFNWVFEFLDFMMDTDVVTTDQNWAVCAKYMTAESEAIYLVFF